MPFGDGFIRISELHGIFVNSRGRCGGKAAMQALHRAIYDLSSSCSFVAVAEADYRRSPDLEEYDFFYYRKAWAVKRKKLANGRALKIFIAKEIEDSLESVTWLNRSVVLRLRSPSDKVQIICSHFSHGDQWDESVDEVLPWLCSPGWRTLLVGDLNVESRSPAQSGVERMRWHSMIEQFASHDLLHRDVDLDFTRLGDDDTADSKIDHAFAHRRLLANVSGTWDQAPGDHCFLLFSVAFRIQWRRQLPRRWKCDWPAFQAYVDSESPDLFGTWSTAEGWLLQAIESHSIKQTRRERRRAWEPFSIKLLRFRIRNSQSELERNQLSKQLFLLRKRHAQERELTAMRGVAARGSNWCKRPSNLFPVTALQSSSGLVSSPSEVAECVKVEFERRWHAMPDDLEPDFTSADVSSSLLSLDIEDVRVAAKSLKRPWIRDCRGIPPASIFASDAFAQAVLPCLTSLLGSDTDWHDLHEDGYVKQKESGGVSASRLRSIIPNSTVLRLLTCIVKYKVCGYAEEFSSVHSLDSRVLGASRGGQPMDIAGTAMMTLQCARDDEDRGAVGQVDVRNYHDSMSRFEMWKSMRRRNIPTQWCSAALRLQRCPRVCLNVRSTKTCVLLRSRGALTGNSLAPWFGKLLIEDAFLAVQVFTDPLAYHFMQVSLYPMAWSDNIFVFAASVRNAAKALAALSDQLERQHLQVKDGSGVIVPASTRKLLWHSVRCRMHTFQVVAETKCLGYFLTCNGDTSQQRACMLGGLRGRIHSMSDKLAKVPPAARAFWWKMQFRGILGFHAAFVGCSTTIFKELGVVSNAGARKVAGFAKRHNHELDRVRTSFNICVQTFFAKCVVKFLGHTFRHESHPFTQLISLPLPERLASLRSQGRGSAASDFAQSTFSFLSHLGFNLNPPVAGPLGIRGHSGYVCRWGEGWFWIIKDGGPGWSFDKTDEAAIEFRINLLLDMFVKSSSNLPNFLGDAAPLPLQDG